MSDFEHIASIVNSRRYARELIESDGPVYVRPWWPIKNTWEDKDINALIRARKAYNPNRVGLEDIYSFLKPKLKGN